LHSNLNSYSDATLTGGLAYQREVQVPAMGGIGLLALGLSMLGLGAVRMRKRKRKKKK